MRLVTVLAAFAVLASCAPAPLAPARDDYNPTITRDEYGIPSVHGRDDQEAAYGIGYAHAEDNFATIQLVVLAARGRLGAHLGEDGAKSDFLWHLLGIREAVEAGFETRLSPGIPRCRPRLRGRPQRLRTRASRRSAARRSQRHRARCRCGLRADSPAVLGL
jgi:acyl-homoserine lactone acylase PvdQ